MKYAIIAISALFVSCSSNLPKKDIEAKDYELNLPNTNSTITEYTIDGCQYFGDLGGDSRDNFLTHKGNCTNPIHNH